MHLGILVLAPLTNPMTDQARIHVRAHTAHAREVATGSNHGEFSLIQDKRSRDSWFTVIESVEQLPSAMIVPAAIETQIRGYVRVGDRTDTTHFGPETLA